MVRQAGLQMIDVYSKPNCPQCTATMRMLDMRGIPYAYYDVTENEAARQHIIKMGYREMPVVFGYGETWTGFRPDKIAELDK